jgi:hypothetical protein
VTAEAADVEAARQVHAQHRPMWLGGRAVCRGCGEYWPCPDMRQVLPVLLADDAL